jgi:hypothetical protein
MAGRDIKFKVKLLDQSVQDLELDASVRCQRLGVHPCRMIQDQDRQASFNAACMSK